MAISPFSVLDNLAEQANNPSSGLRQLFKGSVSVDVPKHVVPGHETHGPKKKKDDDKKNNVPIIVGSVIAVVVVVVIVVVGVVMCRRNRRSGNDVELHARA